MLKKSSSFFLLLLSVNAFIFMQSGVTAESHNATRVNTRSDRHPIQTGFYDAVGADEIREVSESPKPPNEGWTKWTPTYKLQNWTIRADSDRFWDHGNGSFTCMLEKGDARPPGTPGGTRVELRWPDWLDQDAEHMIEADVMYESGTNGTCIMQIKTNTGTGGGGHESVYLNVKNNGNLYHGVHRQVIIENGFDKWHNIKAAYDPVTGIARVWINNELRFQHTYPCGEGSVWYFKNGAYWASATSKVHFKNLSFWVNPDKHSPDMIEESKKQRAIRAKEALERKAEQQKARKDSGGHSINSTITPASQWIYPDAAGKLVYKKDDRGNRIMDFSYAGYMGGGVALPDVPVKVTVRPPADPKTDCTALIQDAINQVSAMPQDSKGFRGAVLLMPGRYLCSQTITVSADGVVLRGSGKTEDGSVIVMTGEKHTAVVLSDGIRQQRGNRIGNTGKEEHSVKITEKYIPSGSTGFTVADASGFKAGDRVWIRKPVTEKWIKFMQMDDMVRDGKPQTWIKAGSLLIAERHIASIEGKTVTLDVPLVDSYSADFANDEITMVLANGVTWLRQVGLESLRIESPSQAVNHTTALYYAVRVTGEDCWLRDLDLIETMESVGFGGHRITAQRVSVIRKARHEGSSKPAEFAPNAGQVLLDRCSVEGDNIWFVAVGGGQTGPIVFLNCNFKGNGRIEGHQRWSTGVLLDNCSAPDGGMDFKNRGSMGSGHGWGTAWCVAWNCEAHDFVNQLPPGTYNWVIGSKGKRTQLPRPWSGPNLPEGIFDSHDVNVVPQSLYLAQLKERLGLQALKNIGY